MVAWERECDRHCREKQWHFEQRSCNRARDCRQCLSIRRRRRLRRHTGEGESTVQSDFYKGWLDEVSIYHRGLSATEIQAIFSAGSTGKCNVPRVVTVSPPGGRQGQQEIHVTLTGQFTHFAQGTTLASFG